MDIIVEGYQIGFAVQVRSVYRKGIKNNEERDEIIWKPTRKFLENIADSRPTKIHCIAGSVYNWPEECFPGIARNFYIANDKNQVAYLGLVFNREASNNYREIHSRRLAKINPINAEKLKRTFLVRDRYSLIVLSNESALNTRALSFAMRKCMRWLARDLLKVKIIWLDGDSLDRKIYQEVKKNS